MNDKNYSPKDRIIAHYLFDDPDCVGKDSSGNGYDAITEGEVKPKIEVMAERKAATFSGGKNGSSYLKLPSGLFKNISDRTGITISSWIYLKKKGQMFGNEFLILVKGQMDHTYFYPGT